MSTSGAIVTGGGGLEGVGFPEGVVTAPVGTRYIDTAATNGAVEWVKASGSGSTGWRVVSGDTGWRDVSSLLINGWTSSSGPAGVKIRRVNEGVLLSVRSLDPAASTSITFLSAITGFAAPNVQGGLALFGSSTSRLVASTVGSIFVSARQVADGAGQACSVSWVTSEAWPSSLPGSATT